MTEALDREWILKKIASIFGPRTKSYIGTNNVVSVVWGRYTIRFDARDPVIDLQQLLTALGRAEARISETVGSLPEKVLLHLCHAPEVLLAPGNGGEPIPEWAGGAFDGTIRVLTDPLSEGTPHSLYVFLTHELVHAALRTMPGRALPCWFEEGLAINLSQNLPGDYREALAVGLARRTVFSLAELNRPFTDLPEDRIPLAYAQSASVVEYLTARMTPEKLRSLIQRAKRRGFEAFLEPLGLNVALLEQEWKRWARRQPATPWEKR